MPAYQGSFQLQIGQRLAYWWPDVFAGTSSSSISVGGPLPQGDVSFRNAGAIHLSSPQDLTGVSARTALNDLFGSLSVVSEYNAPPSLYLPVTVTAINAGDAVNDGRIFARSLQDAIGLSVFQGVALNRGQVRIEAGEFGTGITATQADVDNAGSIIVRAGLQAVGVSVLDTGHYQNAGVISAVSTTPGGIGIGWLTNAYYTDRMDMLNTGVIEADYAYFAYDGGTRASVRGIFDVVTNGSDGQMRGAIYTAFGADAVINHGLITGPVLLGHGDDLFFGTGIQQDAIEGQDGNDALIGSNNTDYLFGGEGADAIYGGGGDDIIGGGRGADVLDGGSGFDTLYFLDATRGVVVDLAAGTSDGTGADRVRNFEGVYGSTYGDRITGSAGENVLEGMAGDDIIDGGKGDDIIAGGTGDDRLTGNLGADVFLFTTGGGRDVIEDFDADDLLSIHGFSSAQSIVQSGADVRVILSDTDSISIRNMQVADLTPGRLTFSSSPLPSELSAPQTQPVLTGDDFVFEAGEQLILTNPRVAYSGGWAVNTGILLYDAQDVGGFRPSVWNAGEIRYETTSDRFEVSAIASFSSGLSDKDTFHNSATGIISVVNHGTALTYGTAGVADNAFNDGLIEASGGGNTYGIFGQSIVNTGRISVTADGWGRGLHSGGNGTIWNTGTIEVHSHDAGAGMYFANARTAVNTGTITVTDDTVEMDSIGVSYSFSGYNGTTGFTNTGIVEADYAIFFGSMSDNHSPAGFPIQTLRNGGELRGIVSLSENGDAFYNTGLITGEVRLRHGDDLFDGRGGQQAAGVHGGDGRDTVYGGSGIDRIDGGGDNDIIAGGGGNDVLTGGSGSDVFVFATGDGHDVITDFNVSTDQLRLIGNGRWQSIEQVGNDTLLRLSETDSILLKNVLATSTITTWFNYEALPTWSGPVTAPSDVPVPVAPPGTTTAELVTGSAGNDTLTGGSGLDRLIGEGGDDILIGGADNDILLGGEGADRLTGGSGLDILYGGAGADIFIFGDASTDGTGSDRIVDFNPAEGDLIYLTGSQNWQISGSQLVSGLRVISLNAVEGWEAAIRYGTPPATAPTANTAGLQYQGTVDADIRLGTDRADTMSGLGGVDILDGRDGDDQIDGGEGDDVLHGGRGTDSLNGGTGDDTLRGGAGADNLSGGDGQDAADYGDALSAVRVDLSLVGTQNTLGGGMDALSGVERLAGSAHDDVLLGTSGANILFGADGDDLLEGRGGSDLLDGADGVDTAGFSGARADYTLSWTDDADDGVTVTGTDGTTRVMNVEWLRFSDQTVSAARPVFTFDGTAAGETSTGSNFHDVMNGNDGDDILNGLDGDDVIHGGEGADRLNGGAGNSQLFGDGGNDILSVRAAANTGNNTAPSRDPTRTLLDGGDGDDIIDFATSGVAIDRVTVRGGQGNDVISVRGAYEVIVDGGAGDDILIMDDADGTSRFTGGSGQDTFRVVPLNPQMPTVRPATITDFQGGQNGDQIDVWPYFAHLFPDIPQGTNLFEAGLMKISQRGPWTDIYAMTGPGGYLEVVATLEGANIGLLTLANFTGMTSGGLGAYQVTGDASDDTIIGNNAANFLTGADGNDILHGEGGDDNLSGEAGDDTLIGGSGNDRISGGRGGDQDVGNDIAVFSGPRSAYTISTLGGMTTVIGPDGTDTLTGVERLRFADGLYDMAGVLLPPNPIAGTRIADTLFGTADADVMNGYSGADTLSGNDGDDRLIGGAGNDALIGGGGIDTADYSTAVTGVTAQLNTGVASNDGDGGTDTFSGIENLTGSAFNDVLFGDAGTNVVRGGAGYDVLIGLAGDDVIHGGSGSANEMYGGLGDDRYVIEAVGDTIVERAGEGTELVETSLARFRLAANVENLTYTGTSGFEGQGNADANIIRGGVGRDALIGFGGDDVLYGGAGAANELYGGTGDDRYVVQAGDTIIEGAGEGVDTVESWLNTFTLRANVENLIFAGTGDFTGIGNASDNRIEGGAGNDRLVGAAGADTLIGGAGRDTADYSGAAAGVTVRLDRNQASNDGDGASDVLSEIEDVRGSAFADVIIGDAAGNTLQGGAGRDVLIGFGGNDVLMGGAGDANEMYGGIGDDRYVVEAEGDTIVEQANEGVDLVQTSLARFRLASNIENLTFTGTGEFIGQGNGENNVIRGGTARDLLVGLGGNDILYGGTGAANELYGGAGDDYYIIEAGDTVIESANDGIDSVEARINLYTLRANVENLVFGGTGTFVGTGNTLNNLIIGGAGDDVLRGGGGSDRIQGGAGTDRLVLLGVQSDYTITAEGNGWRIVDLTQGRDGSILTTSIEIIEFGDKSTRVLTPPANEPADTKADGDALVLPGLTDASFSTKGDQDGPLIQPGVFAVTDDKAGADQPLVLPGVTDPASSTKAALDGPLVQPGVIAVTNDKGGADQPLVQPGSLDDDFLDLKVDTDSVGPQIQPGVFDDLAGVGSGGPDFGGFGFGGGGGGGSDSSFGLWGLDPDIQRALDDYNARLDHMRTTTHITDPWG